MFCLHILSSWYIILLKGGGNMPRGHFAKDLTGEKFGMLTVLGTADSRVTRGGKKKSRYVCKCDCGNVVTVDGNSLTQGRTKSCGCRRGRNLPERNTTHGGSNDRLYKVWSSIKTRCYNSHCRAYKWYGARGIKLCDEWMDYAAFRDWALSNGYDEAASKWSCTIDRIDVNGNYEPSNCRFITMKGQQNNRRSNTMVTLYGRTQTLQQWCEELGMKTSTVCMRFTNYGMTIEEALTTPVKARR